MIKNSTSVGVMPITRLDCNVPINELNKVLEKNC